MPLLFYVRKYFYANLLKGVRNCSNTYVWFYAGVLGLHDGAADHFWPDAENGRGTDALDLSGLGDRHLGGRSSFEHLVRNDCWVQVPHAVAAAAPVRLHSRRARAPNGCHPARDTIHSLALCNMLWLCLSVGWARTSAKALTCHGVQRGLQFSCRVSDWGLHKESHCRPHCEHKKQPADHEYWTWGHNVEWRRVSNERWSIGATRPRGSNQKAFAWSETRKWMGARMQERLVTPRVQCLPCVRSALFCR